MFRGTGQQVNAVADAALALYRAELNERLVVHYIGGVWRVPLGTRHLPVRAADGAMLGRIICAGPLDAQRARAGLVPARLTQRAAMAALAPVLPLLGRLRALEGMADDAAAVSGLAEVCSEPHPQPGTSEPVLLYSAAAWPPGDLVGQIVAAASRGVIWKPAPGAAASAHLIMRALGPVTGRAVALVQGDHVTGQDLIGQGRPVWAGFGPVPATLI